MDKFVLIDGNSLLNRAYYAMSVFTTQDGLPTNGIFGFVKLLFKIIEEEKPQYMAVAFDVHAPTFRHEMYDEYKGTRKPMPEELSVQVPVLKDLLRSMGIYTLEKAGYEADDLIGTLSVRFPEVETLIYTGDRDSFQLVNEHVSVCFTRRGVSEIDRMTQDNFFEKEGISPSQIVEQKSLMGDSSDNIPGVRGIGPKTALSLLQTYGTLDGIYENIAQISGTVRGKLESNRETAYLSHQLATIDTAVPLDTELNDCRLVLPFPEAAREKFARLEFRSLVDGEYFSAKRAARVNCVVCTDTEAVKAAYERADRFALSFEGDVHVYCDGTEFIFPVRENLLGTGFLISELIPLLEFLMNGTKPAIVVDVKTLSHRLDELGVRFDCPAEDVSLLRYLANSSVRTESAAEIAKDYALPPDHCAYALFLAYEEATQKTDDTANERLYRELELPLAYVLLDMERTGVRVDERRFPEFSERFREELETLSGEIYRLAGVDRFNLNSPFQLSEILFEKLGYSTAGLKRNRRGGFSTNAEALERLAEKHEIARLILRYREIQKLQSTYVDGIKPLVSGGVVHTTFNQTMTTTGRLSSANPNLQNIPVRKERGRELRKLFIAREGNALVDADYSQIELRLLAHFSGCPQLVQAYRDGEDIHAATASRVFGVPLSEVTGELRRRAKAVNFGIIYGISPFGLAKDLGCTQKEAAQYIERYFATYADVKEYMEENVERAKTDGYVTTILGRKRFIPELKSPNYAMRAFGERAARNMPLQGSAADVIKLAMVNVSERLKREGMRSKLIMQVHDELILDSPEEEIGRASELLKEEMEGAISLRVPLIAEVASGKSWFDAK